MPTDEQIARKLSLELNGSGRIRSSRKRRERSPNIVAFTGFQIPGGLRPYSGLKNWKVEVEYENDDEEYSISIAEAAANGKNHALLRQAFCDCISVFNRIQIYQDLDDMKRGFATNLKLILQGNADAKVLAVPDEFEHERDSAFKPDKGLGSSRKRARTSSVRRAVDTESDEDCECDRGQVLAQVPQADQAQASQANDRGQVLAQEQASAQSEQAAAPQASQEQAADSQASDSQASAQSEQAPAPQASQEQAADSQASDSQASAQSEQAPAPQASQEQASAQSEQASVKQEQAPAQQEQAPAQQASAPQASAPQAQQASDSEDPDDTEDEDSDDDTPSYRPKVYAVPNKNRNLVQAVMAASPNLGPNTRYPYAVIYMEDIEDPSYHFASYASENGHTRAYTDADELVRQLEHRQRYAHTLEFHVRERCYCLQVPVLSSVIRQVHTAYVDGLKAVHDFRDAIHNRDGMVVAGKRAAKIQEAHMLIVNCLAHVLYYSMEVGRGGSSDFENALGMASYLREACSQKFFSNVAADLSHAPDGSLLSAEALKAAALKCFDAPKVLGQILALNPPGPQNTCPAFLEIRRVHYELHVPNTCDPIYFGRDWSQNLDKFANEVSRDILRNNVRVRDIEAMLDGLTQVWGHHDSGTARVVQAAIYAIMGLVNRYDQAVEVLLEYMDRHMDDSDEVGLWQKCSMVNQCSSRLFYTLRCLRIHTYGLDFHGDEAQKLLENIAAGAFGYSIVPGQIKASKVHPRPYHSRAFIEPLAAGITMDEWRQRYNVSGLANAQAGPADAQSGQADAQPMQADAQPIQADAQPIMADAQPIQADAQPMQADAQSDQADVKPDQPKPRRQSKPGSHTALFATFGALVAQVEGSDLSAEDKAEVVKGAEDLMRTFAERAKK